MAQLLFIGVSDASVSHDSIAREWDQLLKRHCARGQINHITTAGIDYMRIAENSQWVSLLTKHMSAGAADRISEKTKIYYLNYDWSLNDSRRFASKP